MVRQYRIDETLYIACETKYTKNKISIPPDTELLRSPRVQCRGVQPSLSARRSLLPSMGVSSQLWLSFQSRGLAYTQTLFVTSFCDLPLCFCILQPHHPGPRARLGLYERPSYGPGNQFQIRKARCILGRGSDCSSHGPKYVLSSLSR